jgi:SsrA-binding protein
MKIIVQNKKATFDYEIEETFEAGIVLSGDEVKSIRQGHVSLQGSYANMHNGEMYLLNCRVSPYEKAFDTKKNEEYATRSRKLLLHKKEIQKLIGQIARKGVTIVPLSLYLNSRSLIKIKLGLGAHRKAISKKGLLKERDIAREAAREIRSKF